MPPRVAIRVDGNRHIGLGHVFRAQYLAENLAAAGASCRFFMLQSSLDQGAARFLEQAGLPVTVASRPGDPWREDPQALRRAVQEFAPQAVVVDIIQPDPGDSDLLENPEFRPAGPEPTLHALAGLDAARVLVSDRPDRYAPDVDLLLNTCPAQQPGWYAGLDRPRMLLGPAAYILAPGLAALAAGPRPARGARPRLAVFFGGNDHRGFLEAVLPELVARTPVLDVEVALGAATPDGEAAAGRLRAQGIAACFRAPDLGARLHRADLALVTSGNTLFDLAALGVPSLAVATRERQEITARFFEETGCCRYLGRHGQDVPAALRRALDGLLAEPQLLDGMSRRGRQTVPPDVTSRVVGAILQAVEAAEARHG